MSYLHSVYVLCLRVVFLCSNKYIREGFTLSHVKVIWTIYTAKKQTCESKPKYWESLSYRNQSINSICNSVLYNRDFNKQEPQRVNKYLNLIFAQQTNTHQARSGIQSKSSVFNINPKRISKPSLATLCKLSTCNCSLVKNTSYCLDL